MITSEVTQLLKEMDTGQTNKIPTIKTVKSSNKVMSVAEISAKFQSYVPQYYRTKFQLPSRAYIGIMGCTNNNLIVTNSTHLSHPPTDDDGSVSFEKFTKYVVQLSLMESRSESPDSDASKDDPALTTPTDSLTTPILEVATVAS